MAVITETVSEPRMIDGRPDDAPRNAALFLGFFVITGYFLYLVCLGIIKVAFGAGSVPDAERQDLLKIENK